MATKKTTPKSRAMARSAMKRGDAARYFKSEMQRKYSKPGALAESGTAWNSVYRAALAVAKKYGDAGPSSGKATGSSISGGVVPRTKSVQKYESRAKRASRTQMKQAEVQRQIQREVSQTRATAERAAAKTAESRAARQTAGRAADRRAAEGQRVKKVGKSTGKGTPARYKGDRIIDRKGQGGWR